MFASEISGAEIKRVISTSIIIPVRLINDYLRESIPIILARTDETVDILVLPD
jgi:hypothetical protein